MPTKELPRLVVVVEDDDTSRSAMRRLLRAGGFEAALFDSAEAFLASRLDCVPFCVIVDVHLTGMSGLDLQDWLRRQRSDVPVIVTTADRRRSFENVRSREVVRRSYGSHSAAKRFWTFLLRWPVHPTPDRTTRLT
jgi:DNA-binding response OmpR family regulator